MNTQYPTIQEKQIIAACYPIESLPVVTNGRIQLETTNEGRDRLRDTETGRFISKRDLDKIYSN